MKAIIFAVASILVVTATTTASVARPHSPGLAGSHASSGYRSPLPRDAYRARSAKSWRHYTRSGHSGRHHRQYASLGTPASHRGVGARPSRWCGWWMRTQKGGGPELNLASNWRHWGRPTGPRVGAVVVWADTDHDRLYVVEGRGNTLSVAEGNRRRQERGDKLVPIKLMPLGGDLDRAVEHVRLDVARALWPRGRASPSTRQGARAYRRAAAHGGA